MTHYFTKSLYHYEDDNTIIYIFKERINTSEFYHHQFFDMIVSKGLSILDIYNVNDEYDHQLFEGKLFYRTFDESGKPFEEGAIQIHNVDDNQNYYFNSNEEFLDNFIFKEKPIREWYKNLQCLELPIVDLSTYLYFRPHINYDCNFTYKGEWYFLSGEEDLSPDVPYPNYWIKRNSRFNPEREDVYATPLDLLKNYVLHDGTRLWDVKEETVFEWYKKAFAELVSPYP